MSILGREVEMFRTVLDPMIGPKPRQAFMTKDINAKAILTEIGITVTILHTGQEHFVPYTNIQAVRLKPQESTELSTSTQPLEKRGPGRPRLNPV